MFQLQQGNSAETSGGLLICLPRWVSPQSSSITLTSVIREQAAAYCKDIQKVEGYQAWIIGIVEKGNRWVVRRNKSEDQVMLFRTARIIDKPRVIEVPAKEKEGELW